MEAYTKLAVLGLVMAAAIVTEPMGTNGQTLCGMTNDGFMSCKPSVTSGMNPLPPSTACCLALSTADMKCLCGYNNSKLLPAMGIDPALAMQLPDKCNLPASSVHC